jgi:hypothetical protein
MRKASYAGLHQFHISRACFSPVMNTLWSLRGFGASLKASSSAPATLKLLAVALFHLRPNRKAPSPPSGVVVTFAPMVAVFVVWCAIMMPTVFSGRKNVLAATFTLLFGSLLMCSYSIVLTLILLIVPHLALFCGSYIALHATWVLCEVHPDAAYGYAFVKASMRFMGVMCLYLLYSWPATCIEIPDIAYLFCLWVPELVSIPLHKALLEGAAYVLQDGTGIYTNGYKGD